jgi:hypothetical protein
VATRGSKPFVIQLPKSTGDQSLEREQISTFGVGIFTEEFSVPGPFGP